MKKTLLLALLLAIFSSCSEEPGPTIEIKSLLPTHITYDGFQANWEIVEIADFYELVLSESIDFSTVLNTMTISGANSNSYTFEGLKPDKTYYCKVRCSANGEYSEYSGINSVKTNRYNINFRVTTQDGIKLFGNLDKRLVNKSPAPVILFLHQSGQDFTEWSTHVLYKKAVDSGFICAAYDFRAHGRSEGVYSPYRQKYPADLSSVLDYLIQLDYVDSNNIIVVGASLGAIVATGASSYEEVKAAVALTTYYDLVFEIFGEVNLSNVFYIAAEYDNAIDSERLYDITSGYRKIRIISRSDAHGLKLLESGELVSEVYSWINEMVAI